MYMIKEIRDSNIIKRGYSHYLDRKGGGMLIIKADWCGHCKRALPELEQVSRLTGEMFPIYKLDADTNKRTVASLGVMGYPTIFFIEEDGKISGIYEKERNTRAIVNEICSVMRKCF